MKSSGVSRFLTRRDKHHEKRSSKTLPNSNVRLHSSASCSSLTPLLHRPGDAWLRDARCGPRRPSQSLEALYHKLPSALRIPFEDGFLFFHRNTSSCALLTPAIARDDSDSLCPQPRASHHVSPNLYTIFTNEQAHAAADKDADKQVRRASTTLRTPLG
jgi:hypothetical protein